MLSYHESEWKKMKTDTGWYRPNWATLYYSKAVYDFIWRSNENFGDESIATQKRIIKRFVWELIFYFIIVVVLTLSCILTGIL